MNEFEISALKLSADAIQVSKDTLSIYTWGLVVSILSFLLASIAALVGIIGLKHIAGQFASAQLNTLVLIEQEMNKRRQRLAEIGAEISAVESSGIPMSDELKRRANEARESYLNSLERLASSILHAKFDEDEMRIDYKDYFADTIRAMPDDFRTGTRFRKIVQLHEKWADR